VLVPLVDDWAATDVIWHPGADKPALRSLLDVVIELATTTDLTRARGWPRT
jgi:hypothetical protein